MKFSSKVRVFGLLGVGAAVLVGCGAATPPRELVDARSAYARAAGGPARDLEPGALGDARASLSRAEHAFAADASGNDVSALGYVAERKSELADIQARDALNAAQQKQSEAEIRQLQQLQLSSANQRAQVEQERRMDAERRAREALEAQGGGVRQEERGMVITVPGQVVFATGKSTLLPSARQSLNQVADVIKDQPDKNIVVEGHTDSTGTDQKNNILSLQRAENVKDYLTSRGVPASRISARGMGSKQPVATNATPEGRANNRRVEIIVENGPGAPAPAR